MDPTQERVSPGSGEGARRDRDAAPYATSSGAAAGRSSEDIRQDIRRTRERIDHNVDELQDTMEPRRLVHDGWQQIRSQTMPALGRVVRRHPVPIALLGLGTTWLALDLLRDGRNGDSWDLDLDEREGGRRRGVGRLRQKVQHAKSRASEGMEEARHRAHSAREQASGKVRQAGRAVRERGHETADRTRQVYEDNPLAVGAAVFAAGLVAGVSLPSTRWEDRHLGDASERFTEKVKEQAQEVGEAAVERGREAASAAVDAAREELRSEGSNDSPSTSPTTL